MRPELSKRSPYWIERHRYYELKHFCLQYPIWKKLAAAFDGRTPPPSTVLERVRASVLHDPTAEAAEARIFFLDRMELVERVAKLSDKDHWDRLLYGITQGIPYDVMHAKMPLGLTRDEYYERYRKFFWILDSLRG